MTRQRHTKTKTPVVGWRFYPRRDKSWFGEASAGFREDYNRWGEMIVRRPNGKAVVGFRFKRNGPQGRIKRVFVRQG